MHVKYFLWLLTFVKLLSCFKNNSDSGGVHRYVNLHALAGLTLPGSLWTKQSGVTFQSMKESAVSPRADSAPWSSARLSVAFRECRKFI